MGSLWLCLEHNEKQSSTSQYYSDVTGFKLQLVSLVDKEEVINYFTGKIENSECISQELAYININFMKENSREKKYH